MTLEKEIEESRKELRQELQKWRKEAFDNFMHQVVYGDKKSLHEAGETYKLAINQDTSVYLMDKPILSQEVYRNIYYK